VELSVRGQLATGGSTTRVRPCAKTRSSDSGVNDPRMGADLTATAVAAASSRWLPLMPDDDRHCHHVLIINENLIKIKFSVNYQSVEILIKSFLIRVLR